VVTIFQTYTYPNQFNQLSSIEEYLTSNFTHYLTCCQRKCL